MGDIIITGNNGFQHTFVENEYTGLTLITLKNEAGTVTLGTIEIETARARSLFNALAQTAREYFPDNLPQIQGYKTTLDVLQKAGSTRFG